MKRKRIFLFMAVILIAGCASGPGKRPPSVEPPLVTPGTTLNIDVPELKAHIDYLENLLMNKKLSEKDRNTLLDLLSTYRLLLKSASGPATEKEVNTLLKSLYETTFLMEKRYLEKSEKAWSEQDAFAEFMKQKNEILDLYLDRKFSVVIQRCLALQTRFPGGLTPEIGVVFAYSLAEDGMLEEAIEAGNEVLGRIERSADLTQLRGDIARWQLATGQRAQAVKTVQALSSRQDERTAMINDLNKQIEETPLKSDQPIQSVFQPAEGSEAREMTSPLVSIKEDVDALVRKHEYGRARELLLKEKAVREEGPETEEIDRALRNIDEAEAAYEENKKIKTAYVKESFDTAKSLFEEEDYRGAVNTLTALEKTARLNAEAADLKNRAIEKIITEERNRAAEIFLQAKKTDDPQKKRELLESARNKLETLVQEYPQSPLKQKLISNIAIVQREIEKLP